MASRSSTTISTKWSSCVPSRKKSFPLFSATDAAAAAAETTGTSSVPTSPSLPTRSIQQQQRKGDSGDGCAANKGGHQKKNTICFRFVWPVKVSMRQLSDSESIILVVSPKFACVHDHVSFQWSMKMHAMEDVSDSDGDEEEGDVHREGEAPPTPPSKADYVAISLYYVDGPLLNVNVRAKVRIHNGGAGRGTHQSSSLAPPLSNEGEGEQITASRGRECEIAFANRAILSSYIKGHLGQVIRLSLFLEMDASLFNTEAYLNRVCPTPIYSFLIANYRARACSKVWMRKERHPSSTAAAANRPRSASEGQARFRRLDLERIFNQVMEEEREKRAALQYRMEALSVELPSIDGMVEAPSSTTTSIANNTAESVEPGACNALPQPQVNSCSGGTGIGNRRHHLFKKLLTVCCDSCQRRASILPNITTALSIGGGDVEVAEVEVEKEKGVAHSPKRDEGCCGGVGGGTTTEEEDDDEEEDGNTFECPEGAKAEMHDILANLYFNKVALPEMEFVEDFTDFFIDAELADLPVLKRAAERYLCGELNTKKDLMISLLLELLFLAIIFQLAVLKSMTLTELSDRHSELEDVDTLLKREEYQSLDSKIRKICGRCLSDLLDECKTFKEQRQRVQLVYHSQ